MLLVGGRERELIERVGPVLLRRFDDLVVQWQEAWTRTADGPPPIDLPAVTRTAVEEGVEAGLEHQRALARRLVMDGVTLELAVSAILLWEEIVLRRLARDAVEDIFTGAAALNRYLHHVVLYCAEEYSEAVRAERDAVARGMEETDRMKTELISMISHDLKTPLTTIQACAVAMLEADGDVEPEQQQRFFQMILQNAERLSRLISTIVDVSRIEGRALDLVFQPLDLARVIHRLAEGILPAARVRLDLPERLPEVRADRDAVERILMNLIDNAVRFSPDGEPVVVQGVADGSEVEVRVIDRGPGVPEERRPGLFSKFYQVDPSPSGRRSGTGLGLAIVRGLAEAMGGSAGYRPNEPQGSVFWVRIPVGETIERAAR